MRTLYYIPIIHSSADLGSLGKDVSQRGENDLGAEVWQEHLRIVDAFWDAVTRFCLGLDVSGMKLFQDGMVADGDVAAMIVAEGVKSGSKNYLLVRELMNRGATVVKTEDLRLVKEELDRLVQITQAKTVAQKLSAFAKYRMIRDRLLDQRDRFIANQVDTALQPEATGILFIGAYHNVRKMLPSGMTIHDVKDTAKVREYHNLLRLGDRHRARLERLAQYLTAEVA